MAPFKRITTFLRSFILMVCNITLAPTATTVSTNDSLSYSIVGMSKFDTVMEYNKRCYVDKTLFIRDLFMKGTSVNLMTRPRGFGKSLLLSTLNFYLNIRTRDRAHLFSDLKIMNPKFSELRNRTMNKFAVINMDFGAIKKDTFEECCNAIKYVISCSFHEHSYILQGPSVPDSLKRDFEAYVSRKTDVIDLDVPVFILTECLKHYYNGTVKVAILIDEYDTPISYGYFQNYYNKVASFLRSFYYMSLKANSYYSIAVFTGVATVGKESLFSDVDNIEAYTTLSNTFSEYLGFTQEEVKELIRKSGKSGKTEKSLEFINKYFNGYTFGETIIFSPWDVVNYLRSGKVNGWVRSGSRKMLTKLLTEHGLRPVLTIEKLLLNERVKKKVYNDLIFPDLEKSEDVYWTYFMQLGYFSTEMLTYTVVDTSGGMENTKKNVILRLPNNEIRFEISKILDDHFEIMKENVPNYRNLINSLVHGNFSFAQATMEKYIKNAGPYLNEDLEKDALSNYIIQMLGGVEIHYNISTKITNQRNKVHLEILPKKSEGVPIRITIQKASTLKTTWMRLKKKVCPNAENLNPEQTEILITTCKFFTETCLRHYISH